MFLTAHLSRNRQRGKYELAALPEKNQPNFLELFPIFFSIPSIHPQHVIPLPFAPIHLFEFGLSSPRIASVFEQLAYAGIALARSKVDRSNGFKPQKDSVLRVQTVPRVRLSLLK